VASLSQGRTAAAQCGLFTHKSVPVIFEPPCSLNGSKSAGLTKFSFQNEFYILAACPDKSSVYSYL